MKTIVVRLVTDKPVKKTAYQVKGVFIKHYPNNPIIPMLDGRYRNKYLYPRVQVKILDEQIYIVGIKEGADPVLEMTKELELLNFGNITFNIVDMDIEENTDQFQHVDRLLRYKFVSPWIALSKAPHNRYKFLKNNDRIAFLNRLLAQNIVFLVREMGVELKEVAYTKLRLNSLLPNPVDQEGLGAFFGEFYTNFILPDYIGLGNGITRGYGSIHGLYNPEELNAIKETGTTKSEADEEGSSNLEFKDEDVKSLKVANVPEARRKSTKPKTKPKKPKTKKVLSEEFDVISTSSKKKKPKPNKVAKVKSDLIPEREDNNFNTAKYHKKQHEF